TSCEIQPRQAVDVQALNRRVRRKDSLPNLCSLLCVGKWEIHHEPQTPEKSGIEGALHVRSKNGQSAIGLHALKQVADFDIRIPVMAVPDLAALSEKGVGFVKEEYRASLLGCVKHSAEIFFGFTDILTDHAREVDPVKVQQKCIGEYF